jgi:hypothetical protein
MLATGSLVGAATAVRVTRAGASLLASRSAELLRLAAAASAGGGGAPRAQAAFRDELIGLTRDAAELSWRELRRGVDELDWLTRDDDNGNQPRVRPYRVKP